MPSDTPSYAREAPRHYAVASSLEEVLALLIEDVKSDTPFERLVAAAGFEGRAAGVGDLVPPDEASAFAAELAARRTTLGASGEQPRRERDPREALASLHGALLIPADTPAKEFFAVVVVEAEPGHPAVPRAREILATAAPYVFRAAEVHALRAKVGELASQQLRSREALDALPDPVMVMDADARILLANRRVEELLVTLPDDSSGRRHAVETNNLFFSAFRARAILESERRPVARELLLVDPVDGSDLLFEVAVLPFRDAESLPDSSIFVLRDITDLKQATHELELQFGRSLAAEHRARRESERLNVIIENAGVPIFVTDRQTNVVLMNREAERLLEVSRSGPPTAPQVHDIRANDAKFAGFLNEFLLQPRLRREGRLSLVDPDEAREFPALAVSTKILDERYEPTAVVTVLHDLTQEVQNKELAAELQTLNAELEERVAKATHELARRNEQLEEQSRELERASRLKSEFLATMSHELRTPINAVLGYNSLLRDGIFGSLTTEQADAVHRARGAAEHLLSLINDILDLSRVEAGKVHVSASDIELVPFVEQLTESVRPIVKQKALDFVVEVSPDVSPIRTDGTRLRQVLLNLLSNAVKFTDEGSVTLRVEPTEPEAGVRFEVTDTGIGIGEEDVASIFDAFTQADQSATREHGGTGLGLAISSKLIRLMGGTLQVESEVGSGSTFRVELPLEPPMHWGDSGSDDEDETPAV